MPYDSSTSLCGSLVLLLQMSGALVLSDEIHSDVVLTLSVGFH